jgi:hypothetical protein
MGKPWNIRGKYPRASGKIIENLRVYRKLWKKHRESKSLWKIMEKSWKIQVTVENYGKIMENVGKMVEHPFLEAQKQTGIPNSKVKFEMGTPQRGMIISQTSNWGP